MADSQSSTRFLNPWVLHLQKLGLELKCPSCLNLYNKPMLLPCDHIFCSSCVPKSDLFGLECPLCKLTYIQQDVRQAPYMENVVNIYRSLDASFAKHMLSAANTNFPDQLAKGAPMNSTSGPSGFSLLGSKRVQGPTNSSANPKLEKGCAFARSDLKNGSMEQNFDTFERNLSLMTPCQTGRRQQEQHEAVDVDMNQVELSSDSPSSGVSKDVDIDTCYLGSDDAAEKCRLRKSSKRIGDDFQGIDGRCDSNLKKQKQLNQGLPKVQEGHFPPSTVMDLQKTASTGSDISTKPGRSSGDLVAVESDSISLLNFVCAFCQTWKITDASGPMQHFANGNQVVGSEAGRSNVIHVHQNCIEWAPQIFYEGETVVKNLEKELARAAKLKCTSCGLKGAALGCYAKSCRRSYHVPCAYEIASCRWDSDEFLMFCPSHNKNKFPSEKFSKPALKNCTSAQSFDEQKNSCESDFWATSPTGAKDWVLCGSALSADEKFMVVKFANLCGATVTKAWTPNVTHVIAATDTNGACSRTLKVLMAILNGRWILNTGWIKACLQSKSPVDEEPYEISLDNHGCCGGPKTGRIRASNNLPRLFSGLKFFFTGDFVPTYKKDLQELVVAAGGIILENREQLQQSNEPQTALVVYNEDSMMATDNVREESGSQVIAHTWLLDSIASGALQPFPQT